MSEQKADSVGNVTRIDAPHPVRAGTPPAKVAVSAGPVEAKTMVSDISLQVHAGQLARHLRTRQRDLDQREAQLNARVAELEQEARTTRLCIQERSAEQDERQMELNQRAEELEHQVHGVAAREISTDKQLRARLDEIQKCQTEVEAAERRMVEHQQRISSEAESVRVATERLHEERERIQKQTTLAEQKLSRQRLELTDMHQRLLKNIEQRRVELQHELENGPIGLKSRQLEEQEHRLTEAQRQVDESESLLEEGYRELDHERRRVEADRQQMNEEIKERQSALIDYKRRLGERTAEAHRRIKKQRQELEHRETTTQRLRGDATRLHRETLEMRLVVEELWAQLVHVGSAAEVTQSIGQLRRRLTDQFQLEREEAAAQMTELRAFGNRLEQLRKSLHQQRDQLQAWFGRRQDELEEQAARLVARETELAQLETKMRDRVESWSIERQKLNAKVRQLTSQLRLASPIPA